MQKDVKLPWQQARCFERSVAMGTEIWLLAQVNMRGNLSEEYRARHPRAPVTVQWVTGVLLPAPLRPSNGSWSPRYSW